MAKYLNVFDDLDAARLEGSKGLYSPQVNNVDSYNPLNYVKIDEDRFTCSFDDNGNIINIEPVGSAYTINKIYGEPFLGETYIEDYDFSKANRFLVDRLCKENTENDGNIIPDAMACSSCRNNNFVGRNLDWYIKNFGILILHMPRNERKNRYASVGVCSSNPILTREIIENGLLPDMVRVNGATITNLRNNFPVFTTDGINECGVCVNTNIVVHEDGVREDYKPCSGHGGELISFLSLPRFVLDNCKSCNDAIAKLSNLSVVQAVKEPVDKEDSHIMVSDNEKTIVFEWYNNKMVYVEYTKERQLKSPNGLPCIMTNFYNSIVEKNTTNGVTNWDNVLLKHPYAMGIERFNTLVPDLTSVNGIDEMAAHIERVLYSKFFDYDSLWYTENARFGYFKEDGQWKYYKNFNETEIGIATDVKDAMVKCYATYQIEADTDFESLEKQMNLLNNGEESEHWYTELTTIFDIDGRCIYIKPQEGYYTGQYYRFDI